MLYWMLTGFAIGFAGSLHCIGMCGPIALSLPLQHHAVTKKIILMLLYNFGRVIAYALTGFLLGVLGNQIVLAKYQQVVSIVLGSMMLLILIAKKRIASTPEPIKKFHFFIQQKLAKALSGQKNYVSYLSIGMLNGLLPCGLVYVAVASAIIAGAAYKSSLFMVMFGLGTMPLMIAVMVFAHNISFKVRYRLRKLTPIFIGCMAILLIMRGMNLGIPYISPHIETKAKTAMSCCHKK